METSQYGVEEYANLENQIINLGESSAVVITYQPGETAKGVSRQTISPPMRPSNGCVRVELGDYGPMLLLPARTGRRPFNIALNKVNNIEIGDEIVWPPGQA